jgi:hypothetical protein
MSDFYERNKIERPVPNATSASQLLDGRSREMILRCVFEHMKDLRRWRGTYLWSWVSAVTGHGSGYSTQICHEMGWDPDMTISPKAELPRTAGPSTRGGKASEVRTSDGQ